MTFEATRRDILRAGGLVVGGALVSGAIADVAAAPAFATGGGGVTGLGNYISMDPRGAALTLVRGRSAAPIAVSGHDYPGVVRAAGDLQSDIERVTGVRPASFDEKVPAGRDVVIIGTVGHSRLIDDLVAANKLDVSVIQGRRETSLQQVVQNPLPGVRAAFVIAGSDQRGTIYGIYDVSRKIGVCG